MTAASKHRYLPPCRVCGDRASGLHYGVNTCEACKGFYRRSFARKRDLKCKTQNEVCNIRFGQNNCSFCRYQKCVQLGMSKQAIKIGRYTNQLKANNIREVVELSKNDWSSAGPLEGRCTSTYPVTHMTSYSRMGRDVRTNQNSDSATKTLSQQDIGRLSIIDLLSKPALYDVTQSRNEASRYTSEIKEINPHPQMEPLLDDWSRESPTDISATNQLPAISEFVDKRRSSKCDVFDNNYRQNADFDWLPGIPSFRQDQLKVPGKSSIETEHQVTSYMGDNANYNTHSSLYSPTSLFPFADDSCSGLVYDFCDTNNFDQNWGVLVT